MASWRTDGISSRNATVTETSATTPAQRTGREAEQQPEPVAVPESNGASLKAAVEQLEAFVRDMERDLAFRIDEASGRVVVSVIDGASGEVIRQMPSEDVLRLAARLDAAGLNLLDPRGIRA